MQQTLNQQPTALPLIRFTFGISSEVRNLVFAFLETTQQAYHGIQQLTPASLPIPAL
jgi:hypothetical protein